MAALVPVFILAWLVVGALVVRLIGWVIDDPCDDSDLWWAVPLWPVLAAPGLILAVVYGLYVLANPKSRVRD